MIAWLRRVFCAGEIVRTVEEMGSTTHVLVKRADETVSRTRIQREQILGDSGRFDQVLTDAAGGDENDRSGS